MSHNKPRDTPNRVKFLKHVFIGLERSPNLEESVVIQVYHSQAKNPTPLGVISPLTSAKCIRQDHFSTPI